MNPLVNDSFRVALLIARTVGNHASCTPPNPPAAPNEKSKYLAKPEPKFGETGFTIVHAAWTAKIMIHIINGVELIALLSSMGLVNLPLPYPFEPTANLSSVTPSVFLGTLLLCAGAILRVTSYRHLGRFFTYELSIKTGQKLVTDGPYAIVRHPSYTAMWMYGVGAVVAQLGPGSAWSDLGLWKSEFGMVFGVVAIGMLAYVNMVMVFLRVEKEDAMLKQEFKDEWTKWAAHTPWKLIPFMY